jgi:hypothetical protein
MDAAGATGAATVLAWSGTLLVQSRQNEKRIEHSPPEPAATAPAITIH